MIHEGAGHVAAVQPGVADWRHGRPGRTGERSRARRGMDAECRCTRPPLTDPTGNHSPNCPGASWNRTAAR